MEKIFIFASLQTGSGLSTQVESIGELSPYGRSFSQYVQDIVSPVIPDCVLSLFGEEQAEWETETIILALANINNIITQNASTTQAYLNSYILTNFGVEVIMIGTSVMMGNKRWYDFVTLKLNEKSYTVVCSDAVWRRVYSNYEIKVIPQLPIEEFKKPYDQVAYQLSKVTSADIFEQINQHKSKASETAIIPVTHSYQPTGTTPIPVVWHCLVYGPFGKTKEALESAITTQLEEAEIATFWQMRFPTLYNKKEMFILPLWENIALTANDEIVYSAIVKDNNVLAKAIATCVHLPADFIKNNLIILPTAFKFLNCLFVPSQYVDSALFLSLIASYLPVSTTSGDFARMNIQTQQLALIIYELLSKAEQFSDYGITTAPVVIKNNKRFLTSSYGDFILYVEIKS